MLRIPAALLLTVLCVAAVIPVAAQDAAPPTGLTLSPARVDADLETRDVDTSVAVINGLDEAREVVISVRGLAHDLEGTPQFPDDHPATAILSADTAELSLEPGERADVRVTGTLPQGATSVYAGLVAEVLDDSAPAGQIQVRSQVASIFLVRGPRPWVETVEVADVGLRETDEAAFQVFAVARDTGDVHIRPAGVVEIEGPDGEDLGTVELTQETILPDLARRLVGGFWEPPPGFTGEVRLTAVLTDPDATGSAVVRLQDGRLAGADGAAGGTDAANPGGVTEVQREDERPGGWAIAVAGLLLFFVLLLLLIVLRQRRKDEEAVSQAS
jgi:hypothetical protein